MPYCDFSSEYDPYGGLSEAGLSAKFCLFEQIVPKDAAKRKGWKMVTGSPPLQGIRPKRLDRRISALKHVSHAKGDGVGDIQLLKPYMFRKLLAQFIIKKLVPFVNAHCSLLPK